MSKLKRFASVLLALVMCFGLTVTAFATDTYTITVNNSTEGYTYAAYQVFAGTLADDGSLTDISWGSGINKDNLSSLYTALTAISIEVDNPSYVDEETTPDVDKTITVYPFTADETAGGTALTTAEAVAAALSKYNTNTEIAEKFAKKVASYLADSPTATADGDADNDGTFDGSYIFSGLAAGYYLVKNTVIPNGGSYTNYILEVTGDTTVTVTPKVETPTFNKTIDDINDSTTTTYTTSDTDSADYDINDEVHYTLTATLPSNYADYDTYQLVFHDVMDSGLTFTTNSVSITVTTDSQDYTVASSCYDLKTATNSETSTYTGHDDAGNSTFEIKIDDTNSLVDGNSAEIPVNADSIIKVTYTAKLTSGAGYAEWNYAYLEYSNNPTWTGTGSGPTGTTPEDEVVVITLKLVVNKTESDGTTALEGATFKLSKYDAETSDWKEVSTIVGTSQSTFTWDGLDDGRYKLEETNAPDGYKAIDTIYFTVAATHDETITDSENKANTLNGESAQYAAVLKTLTVTQTDEDGNELDESAKTLNATATAASGTITTSVANSKTASMPSTGGIGTTIFYVVGGVLVVGAVVLLITRKRMQDDQ